MQSRPLRQTSPEVGQTDASHTDVGGVSLLTFVVAVESIVRSRTDPVSPLWLTAVLREAGNAAGDVMLVGSASDLAPLRESIGDSNGALGIGMRMIEVDERALVPARWLAGLREAQGTAVAFTSSQFVLGDGWAAAALGAFGRGFAGVGGRVRISPDASIEDRAIFALRYASVLGDRASYVGDETVHDIAADNAAYLRAALVNGQVGDEDGFWEVEVHPSLRAAGASFALTSGMTATFVGPTSVERVMRQRFAHGQHFARWRLKQKRVSRARLVLAAPLVPFILLMRARRALERQSASSLGVLASLQLLRFAAAWAAGEASAAWMRSTR